MSYWSYNDKEKPVEDVNLQAEVHIDNEVYDKIMYWVNKSNYEVSGLGTVEYDEEAGLFRVTDAFLLTQENSMVTTDIDATAIGQLMAEVYRRKDVEGTLNFWWHSHVDMDVFWSQTDLDTIHQLGQHGWFLSTVFNKKEEMRSAFYQRSPFNVFADKLPTQVIYPYDDSREAEWDREYQEKVTIKKWKPRTRYSGWGQSSFPDWEGPSHQSPSRFNDSGDYFDADDPYEWMDDEMFEAYMDHMRRKREDGETG